MKLNKEEVNRLMTIQLFQLNEEQLKAVAYLLCLEISKFKKNDFELSFTIKIGTFSALVVAYKDTCASMGRNAKNMVSFGGCHTFARMVWTFRTFRCYGRYELMIQSKEALEIYERKEWQELVLLANDLVEKS